MRSHHSIGYKRKNLIPHYSTPFLPGTSAVTTTPSGHHTTRVLHHHTTTPPGLHTTRALQGSSPPHYNTTTDLASPPAWHLGSHLRVDRTLPGEVNYFVMRLKRRASFQKDAWWLSFCRNCRFMKPFVVMCFNNICLFVSSNTNSQTQHS